MTDFLNCLLIIDLPILIVLGHILADWIHWMVLIWWLRIQLNVPSNQWFGCFQRLIQKFRGAIVLLIWTEKLQDRNSLAFFCLLCWSEFTLEHSWGDAWNLTWFWQLSVWQVRWLWFSRYFFFLLSQRRWRLCICCGNRLNKLDNGALDLLNRTLLLWPSAAAQVLCRNKIMFSRRPL